MQLYIYVIIFFILGVLLKRYSYNFYMFFLLPGTIAHEFSHFIFGLITFSSPTKFSLIPHKDKDSGYWTLGSVSFSRLNMFNAIFTGLAPLSLVYVAYIIYAQGHLNHLLLSFIVYQLLISSIPSKQDLKIVFSYKLGIIFYVTLCLGGYYLNENYNLAYLLDNFKLISNRFFKI